MYLLDSEQYKKDKLLNSLRSSGRYNHKIQLLMGDLDGPVASPAPKRRKSSMVSQIARDPEPFSDKVDIVDTVPKHSSDAVSQLWEQDEPHEFTIWLGNSHFPAPIPMYRDEVCNICHLFCLIH